MCLPVNFAKFLRIPGSYAACRIPGSYAACSYAELQKSSSRGIVKHRSSCLQMFFKIGVLKIFTNFTGKPLSWILFLIKNPVKSARKTPVTAYGKSYFEKFGKISKICAESLFLNRWQVLGGITEKRTQDPTRTQDTMRTQGLRRTQDFMRTQDPMRTQEDPTRTQNSGMIQERPRNHIMCLIWWNLQFKTDFFIIAECI